MSTQSQSAAERLKAEGNALFIKNDFAGAHKKYTEALKHDDKNATLYCNRAACSLGLNKCALVKSGITQTDELSIYIDIEMRPTTPEVLVCIVAELLKYYI